MANRNGPQSANAAGISLAVLFGEMWFRLRANRRNAAIAAGGAFLLAVFVTLLMPRQYVASMVVTPVESSLTDPSALMTAQGFSIRTPFSFNEGPPPQMAAFIKLLKSPEVARRLTRDPGAMAAISASGGSWLGAVLGIFSGEQATPNEAEQIHKVLGWLSSHITVDQDVDVRTWTISLRYPGADGAMFLLSRVHAADEDILRNAAIDQFTKEKRYGLSFLNTTTDAQEKQIIYGILGSIDRSLLVLRSGANVATIVISSPYAPDRPNYPSRMVVFLILLGSLFFVLFAALAAHCHRSIKRGQFAARPHMAPAAANG